MLERLPSWFIDFDPQGEGRRGNRVSNVPQDVFDQCQIDSTNDGTQAAGPLSRLRMVDLVGGGSRRGMCPDTGRRYPLVLG